MLCRLLMNALGAEAGPSGLPHPALRLVLAGATALAVALAACPFAVAWQKRMKIGEKTEKTPIEEERLRRRIASKSGTPTMGGVVVLGGLVLGCLLWTDPGNPHVAAALLSVLALALLGLTDDVMKLRGTGRTDRGLKARNKIIYQVIVGVTVGLMILKTNGAAFAPDGLFSGARPLTAAGPLAVLLFLGWSVVVVGTMSNATNVTDGLDGLLAGLAPMAALVLGAACWVAGDPLMAAQFRMAHVPGARELSVFCAALSGACVGFLWHNRYPARIFMGDTGALAIGGGLAAVALAARMELILALAGIVFVVELGSSVLQIGWYKVWRRRILPVAPIHHIFQRQGLAEPRIVFGFYLWGALAALLGLNLMCF